MKKYLKISLVPLVSILVLTIIFSLINLFNVSIFPLLYLLLTIAIFFIYGYMIADVSMERGYTKGLLCGALYSAIFFLLSLIFKTGLSLYMIIFYLLIIISSSLGAMASNLKKNSYIYSFFINLIIPKVVKTKAIMTKILFLV